MVSGYNFLILDYAIKGSLNCNEFWNVLMHFKAERMVIAHTVQNNWKINTHCGNRLFKIDVAISSYMLAKKPANDEERIAALEIVGNKFTAIYPNKREPFSGAVPFPDRKSVV